MQHSSGYVVDLVGIDDSSRGRSCESHSCCGNLLECDTVIRLRRVQIINDAGVEESAIAGYWVTDAIDRCRVGFLPKYCVKHHRDFDGKLCQVIEMLDESEFAADRRRSFRNKGVCRIALLHGVQRHALPLPEDKENDDDEIPKGDTAVKTTTTVEDSTIIAAGAVETNNTVATKPQSKVSEEASRWLERRIRECSDTPLSPKQLARRKAKETRKVTRRAAYQKKPPITNADKKKPPIKNNKVSQTPSQQQTSRRTTRTTVAANVCYKNAFATDDESDYDCNSDMSTDAADSKRNDDKNRYSMLTIGGKEPRYKNDDNYNSDESTAADNSAVDTVIDGSTNLLLTPTPRVGVSSSNAGNTGLFTDFLLSPMTGDTTQLTTDAVKTTKISSSTKSSKPTRSQASSTKYNRPTRSQSSKTRSNKKY
jgi:hypothetical protein